MTFAFAAAGTGGHVYPALAVADALVAAGIPRREIVFFGGDRMEAEIVPAAGYDYVGVEIRGLRRSLSPQNLKLVGLIRRAAKRMVSEMKNRSVRSVGVFGGYISVPAAMAARRSGAAVVVHEQNAHPGLANRLISRRARSTLVAYAAAQRRLSRARVVGNPLRSSLAAFDRDALRSAARERYGLQDDRPILGILGGSLGAAVLNDVARRIVADADPTTLAILHLTGSLHIDDIEAEARRSPVTWITRAFEPEMEYFYAASDTVLGRAGALTVSELSCTGTPAVLVPLEATHQVENTTLLEKSGGAVVVLQTEANRVPIEVQQLLFDVSRRERMASASKAMAAPGAAEAVARELMEAADG